MEVLASHSLFERERERERERARRPARSLARSRGCSLGTSRDVQAAGGGRDDDFAPPLPLFPALSSGVIYTTKTSATTTATTGRPEVSWLPHEISSRRLSRLSVIHSAPLKSFDLLLIGRHSPKEGKTGGIKAFKELKSWDRPLVFESKARSKIFDSSICSPPLLMTSVPTRADKRAL